MEPNTKRVMNVGPGQTDTDLRCVLDKEDGTYQDPKGAATVIGSTDGAKTPAGVPFSVGAK